MATLFDKARKTPVKKESKAKDEKVRITIEDPSFFDKIAKLEELQDVMKSSKARADMIADELRDISKEKWCELYSKTGKNPGSVMVEHRNDNDDVSQLMFVPSDKYITITSERADELKETFGDEIVEEKTTFSFDNDMISKYGEILSKLIEECGDIEEKDREKIIKATTSFSVAKGTIDNLTKYGDVAEVMEAVKPVIALKNVEIIKS